MARFPQTEREITALAIGCEPGHDSRLFCWTHIGRQEIYQSVIHRRRQCESCFGLLCGGFAQDQAFTPVAQVAALATVNPALPGLTRDTVQPPAIALLGPENSARGGATAHLDVGASFRFSGPWDSQVTLGASALNLTYGPVAPLSPTDPWFSSVRELVPIRYERRFKIPPVPTVSLRIEF